MITDSETLESLAAISRQIARLGFGIYLDETPMRQHLIRSDLIENTAPRGKRANYVLTDKAKRLLSVCAGGAR